MGLGFYRMDKVRELDGVLDKEHRHVVADQIEVAFLCVELHRKAAYIAGVHDALRNTLVVKVRDLFTHDEIFQQRRPASAGLQAVLVIGDFHPLIGAQRLASGVGTEFFQALQLGIGVATVQGIGAGKLALGRPCGFLGTHQTKLLVCVGQSGPWLV